MSSVETIEKQVRALTPQELAAFRDWFIEFEWENWDRQLERDVASGKLDALAQKAREAHAAGRTRPL
jgi:hypothetical protein